ncbi:uncharacterized protein LOC131598501 [Vicia villosa]|uniref:uncharacterized protein LOC131598501 n=1 Tax=Vicia villosa TaxID=3911 RepID=UPI00273B4CFA|nr:uncharacterized protein LOC131598501 [Vicia villosa]
MVGNGDEPVESAEKRIRPNAGEEGDASQEAGTNNAETQTGTNNVETQTGTINAQNQTETNNALTSNLKNGKTKMAVKSTRRRSSERIKENWFKKPKQFTSPSSNPDQPICMDTEEREASKTTPKKAGKATPKKATPKKTTPKKK